MAFHFKFPDVGEGISEGVIVKWLVKEGDAVKADQALAEVETDKAVVELPSPRAGKILKLNFAEGAEIKVGQVIVEIEVAEGEATTMADNQESVGVVGSLPGEVTVLPPEGEEHVHAPSPAPTPSPATTPASAPVASVAPANAAVTMKKVRKYDLWGYIEHVPFKGIRKSIAQHMSKSIQTAVHVTHTDQVDMSKLAALRAGEKSQAEKDGIKLTYLAYIMKAVQQALEQHPTLNASLDDANEDLILKKYYNIAFAVDTEDGLLAPVIKRVNQKTHFEIAKEIVGLAEQSKSRKLNPMDMKGGSFTITNVGSIGGLFFTPIINHPDVAILGLGRLHDTTLAIDGKVEIRPVLPLSLAFDHRVLDGAEAARFTNTLIDLLQNPEKIILAAKDLAKV